MERGKITIGENGVKINPINGTIWLSAWEIAKLFDVFPGKVSGNIKVILKSEVLRENDVSCCKYYSNGGSVDLYSLEMIMALAFRIKSRNSEIFRNWLMKRACYGHSAVTASLCDERKISLN
ncbi:MAG: protein-tyrosine kinase [Bacteroidales bacterium]